MEEAHSLFSERLDEFATRALSQVIYLQNRARLKLEKAHSMLRNLIGDHFMTALCLKELADFYFVPEKTREGLEKATNYYKEAMDHGSYG